MLTAQIVTARKYWNNWPQLAHYWREKRRQSSPWTL